MPYSFIFLVISVLFVLFFYKKTSALFVFFCVSALLLLTAFFIGDFSFFYGKAHINLIIMLVVFTWFFYFLFKITPKTLFVILLITGPLVLLYNFIIHKNLFLMTEYNRLIGIIPISLISIFIVRDGKTCIFFVFLSFIAIEMVNMLYWWNDLGYASGFGVDLLDNICITLGVVIVEQLIFRMYKKVKERKKVWIK